MKNNFIRILFIFSHFDKRILILTLLSAPLSHFLTLSLSQNVGIGTTAPHTSSKLEINSTTTGVLIPRMSTAQRNAIVSPAVGLLVYDLDKYTVYMYNGYTRAPLIFGSNA